MSNAIFTLFNNHNYGAVLQAYALRTVTEELTQQPTVLVNYIRDPNTNLMHIGPIYHGVHGRLSVNSASLKKLKSHFTNFQGSVVRILRCRSFIRRHLAVTKPFYTGDPICLPGTDYYFLGSDQIWNLRLMKGFHDAYFGITADKPKKVIAYAPSMGNHLRLTDEEAAEMKRRLQNVDVLSSRESDAAALLSELTGRDVACVIDPTLLLTAEQWDAVASRTVRLPAHYVLVYSLDCNEELLNAARRKAEELGCSVLLLSSPTRIVKGVDQRRGYGPAEFLAAVRSADHIFTNSFHGTVFSINYHRPFTVKADGDHGIRMRSICSQLHLESRYLETGDFSSELDFSEADRRLQTLRDAAMRYLQDALQ